MVENAEASRVALCAYTSVEEPSMLFDAYAVKVTLSFEQLSVNAMRELSGERMLGKNERNLSCIITVSRHSAHTFAEKKSSVHFSIHKLPLTGGHICYGAGLFVCPMYSVKGSFVVCRNVRTCVVFTTYYKSPCIAFAFCNRTLQTCRRALNLTVSPTFWHCHCLLENV